MPPITLALILLNVLVYALALATGPQIIRVFGLWPPGSGGALHVWQLVTYSFLHGSLTHLGFNMFAVWMFGAELERRWNDLRYLLTYLLSVVVAAMFPGPPNADASDRFCQRLIAVRSHIYFTQVLRLDLARALRRLATKAEKLPSEMHAEYQLELWGTNSLVRQRWLARGARRFDDFLKQFVEAVELPLTNDLWRQSLTIMGVEALDATDALHLATARWIDIADFATTDRDFRRITHPRIHLVRDDDPSSGGRRE